MRTRYIAACILIVGGIAFFLLQSAPKRRSEASQETVQEPTTNAQKNSSSVVVEKSAQPPLTKNAANDLLASAYETARFVDHVLNSVPPERVATRSHLRGIQVVFFVSDYVMAAKANNSLLLSESAIIAAFTNVTQDTSFLRDRLRTWAIRPGTLSDHYRSISEIPAEQENIKAIKAALIENGLAIDTESDLLMDCIRYAVHTTGIHEMYGPNPRHMNEATPFPAEVNSLVDTGDTVFAYRFAEKFGIDPRTITNLMNQLKNLRVYDLSPSDVEIPVTRFQ